MTIGITTVMLLLLSERIVPIKYKQRIELKREIEGNNQVEDEKTKSRRMKGKKWYTPRGTPSPNIGTYKEV